MPHLVTSLRFFSYGFLPSDNNNFNDFGCAGGVLNSGADKNCSKDLCALFKNFNSLKGIEKSDRAFAEHVQLPKICHSAD